MKCVKIVLILFAIFIFFVPSITKANDEVLESQKEALNISDFINTANEYSKKTFPEINMKEVLNSAVTGKVSGGFWQKIAKTIIGRETTNAIRILGTVLGIIIIHSILKSISDGLENKGVSQIIYYVEYILIVTLIMTNFAEMIKITKETIENLVGFMNSLAPILITLMVTTGNIATANIVQPVVLIIIGFIGNIIVTLILPFIMISTVLGIISNISSKVQIGKLSKYFKSSIVWILGVTLTIFVGVISIEGTLSSSVDGITAKTAKAAVTNFIPVVGKILGDAVDAVLGAAVILKNAVGFVGVLVIISICAVPIIRLAILTITYHIATAICEIIADEKIVKILEQMAGSFKILLATLFSVSTMLLIGVTLVIKISNSGLMYR